jgi:hypothetical protein
LRKNREMSQGVPYGRKKFILDLAGFGTICLGGRGGEQERIGARAPNKMGTKAGRARLRAIRSLRKSGDRREERTGWKLGGKLVIEDTRHDAPGQGILRDVIYDMLAVQYVLYLRYVGATRRLAGGRVQ